MKPRINIPSEQVRAFCRRWQIDQLSLFGSVLTEEFGAASDVDVLVSFMPQARPTLLDMAGMRSELEEILGRNVDLVSRRGVEMSRNEIRKKAILESAEVVYGA